MRFPNLPRRDRIGQSVQTAFGGLEHTPGAGDGALWDMQNLWSGDAPRLGVRPKRKKLGTLTAPNGLFNAGRRFTADGTTLYVDGVSAGTLTDSQRSLPPWGSGS